MPSRDFVLDWLKADETFANHYARAKSDMADAEFDALIGKADSAIGQPPEVVNAVRLAVDTRKWVLSKLLPKKYGDKAAETHITTAVNVFALSIEQQKDLQERRRAALEG